MSFDIRLLFLTLSKNKWQQFLSTTRVQQLGPCQGPSESVRKSGLPLRITPIQEAMGRLRVSSTGLLSTLWEKSHEIKASRVMDLRLMTIKRDPLLRMDLSIIWGPRLTMIESLLPQELVLETTIPIKQNMESRTVIQWEEDPQDQAINDTQDLESMKTRITTRKFRELKWIETYETRVSTLSRFILLDLLKPSR